MFNRIFFSIFLFLVTAHTLLAQDFVGIATVSGINASESVIEGQLSINLLEDDLVLLQFFNSAGEIIQELGYLQSDGQFFTITSSSENLNNEVLDLTIVSTTSGSVVGLGWVRVDRPDLGPGWVPLDINDSTNWTGCEGVADTIQTLLGGTSTRHTIEPTPPAVALGPYRNITPGWGSHCVVVKNGLVYDGFGPSGGLPIEEYEDLWDYADDLDFNWDNPD